MQKLARRQILINEMDKLAEQGINCQGCVGICCTYEANSMMVTPLEAVEIIVHLKSQNKFNESLKIKCQQTITDFRLDKNISVGKKSLFRRTYTCPFFNHQELGCPLPFEVKPYGCLAFNTHHSSLKNAEHCYSDQNILRQRQVEFPKEDLLNQRLKDQFKLDWDKTPIPMALIDLWDKSISDEDLALN